VNPDPSTFNAGTAPAPTVGPSNFGVSNSVIRDFSIHAVVAPASHRIADLRIGTTWASVTPISGPALSLGNVYSPIGSNAVFVTIASVVTHTPDLPTFSMLSHSNVPPLRPHIAELAAPLTATLVISNVHPADLGLYTVNGTNSDPLTSALLTGSASAILTNHPP